MSDKITKIEMINHRVVKNKNCKQVMKIKLFIHNKKGLLKARNLYMSATAKFKGGVLC